MTVYKSLAQDARPLHGGRGDPWPMPGDGEPGQWYRMTGDLVACGNGLHLARDRDLVGWVGPVLYEAESEPGCEVLECEDKVVAGSARLVRRLDSWNEESARLFACDCAERVLSLVPGDGRDACAQAIEVARRYARGSASARGLRAAASAGAAVARAASLAAPGAALWSTVNAEARDAAGSGSWDATWGAMWAATRGSDPRSAWDTTWEAALQAGKAGAWDAVGDAAGALVGITRSAGWAAARDAAWGAARAFAWASLDTVSLMARDAEWVVARATGAESVTGAGWSDLRAEARSAFWVAERAWQTDRLFWYLRGEQGSDASHADGGAA